MNRRRVSGGIRLARTRHHLQERRARRHPARDGRARRGDRRQRDQRLGPRARREQRARYQRRQRRQSRLPRERHPADRGSAELHPQPALGLERLVGEDNFSATGFPHADTDIYENRIRYAWDDGIEAEGDNRNVRVCGNYIDETFTGIATAATHAGPIYIFRNIYDVSRYSRTGANDSSEHGPFGKLGDNGGFGGGRRYYFHSYRPSADSIHGNGSSHDNDVDYDLHSGGSLGHDAAERLPGFNDDFLGQGPDIGAAEAGASPLRLGREAARP